MPIKGPVVDHYLVTGGAGFIGSHIVRRLVHLNKKVRVLDSLLTGKLENLADIINEIEFIEGDIRNLETCRRAVLGVDGVLHQAALTSVQRSIFDPQMTNAINITGTLNMLVAARESSTNRFVFASSSSVYGSDPRLPKREGNEGTPLSPYAASKLAGEYYCRLFGGLYGMATVSLRYFNVFGPRQDPNSPYSAAIPLFITKALKGESPIVYGDGEQSRDFTFVENVVMANILASEAQILPGETMNIACGEGLSVNTLLKLVDQMLGIHPSVIYSPERPGDIAHSVADISRAKEIMGYSPRVSQMDGLKRTIAWYSQFS